MEMLHKRNHGEDQGAEREGQEEGHTTVKPRYNGSKSNGNPPIRDLKTWSLHVNFF